jgi:hypothetical protein
MAIKKKSKAPAGKKAKSPAKKTAKKSIAKSKRTPVKQAKKPVQAKAAKPAKRATKSKARPVVKKPVADILPHGEDQHLIPVTGEIYPARIEEKQKFENNFKHNEEVALHQEQNKVKNVMAQQKVVKRNFPKPRQS